MRRPKAGDRATKNGITCYVLDVSGGKVFGVRFAREDDGTMLGCRVDQGEVVPFKAVEFVYDRRPLEDRLFGDNRGEFWMAVVDWQAATVDADYREAEG